MDFAVMYTIPHVNIKGIEAFDTSTIPAGPKFRDFNSNCAVDQPRPIAQKSDVSRLESRYSKPILKEDLEADVIVQLVPVLQGFWSHELPVIRRNEASVEIFVGTNSMLACFSNALHRLVIGLFFLGLD